jgi:hypothetical protein
MAFKATYEIKCSCGNKFTGDFYEYIFTEYDQELKDALLTGELNWTTCPSCGERLHVENRFLYRDERNKLWVWVCKRGEEPKRDELFELLMEKNLHFKDHHLDNKEDYKKYLVFGRDSLVELLLKKDRELKRREGRRLKQNSAIRLLVGDGNKPGLLFLKGEKVRIAIPLELPEDHEILHQDSAAKRRWLRFYSQGLNIHNPYSSFLSVKLGAGWNRLMENKGLKGPGNEYEAFARSWADFKTDVRKFTADNPEIRRFFDEVEKIDITRKVRSMTPGR